MIELENVTKRFGTALAVDDLSLTVEEGEVVVLLGSSGCGKTTTLRMINRLVEPTSGTIRIAGRDVMTMPAHQLRRGVGYVIQQSGLFPHRTVLDNVTTVPRLLGLGQAPAQRTSGRAARARRPRRLAGDEVPGTALRWPAAARRCRPGARRRPAGAADGRAVRCRRPDRPRPAAARVPPPATGDGQDGRVRHPRRRRGDRSSARESP